MTAQPVRRPETLKGVSGVARRYDPSQEQLPNHGRPGGFAVLLRRSKAGRRPSRRASRQRRAGPSARPGRRTATRQTRQAVASCGSGTGGRPRPGRTVPFCCRHLLQYGTPTSKAGCGAAASRICPSPAAGRGAAGQGGAVGPLRTRRPRIHPFRVGREALPASPEDAPDFSSNGWRLAFCICAAGRMGVPDADRLCSQAARQASKRLALPSARI